MGSPLPWGAVRPTGDLLSRLRAEWEAIEPVGEPRDQWLALALVAGGGRGRIAVRRWKDQNPAEAAGQSRDPGQTFGLVRRLWNAVTAGPDGVQVTDYLPFEARFDRSGAEIRLEVETSFPPGRQVQLRFRLEPPAEFTLRLAMPPWAAGCLVTGVGVSGSEVEEETGWIALRRTWGPGDQVELVFDGTPPGV